MNTKSDTGVGGAGKRLKKKEDIRSECIGVRIIIIVVRMNDRTRPQLKGK